MTTRRRPSVNGRRKSPDWRRAAYQWAEIAGALDAVADAALCELERRGSKDAGQLRARYMELRERRMEVGRDAS